MTPVRALVVLLSTLVAMQAPAAAQAPAATPPPATGAPAAVATPTGSKVWIGHEAEFEHFIATAPITKADKVPVGVTHPMHAYFAPGGLAAGIAFKPLRPGREQGYFESYKSEIAAYELDKLLGLGMVPPTVERDYNGDTGSAQLWVENCKFLKDVNPNTSPDIGAWNRQVYRQRVFDNLIGNIDRNAGNLLVDPSWNLILIDHSRAFAEKMSKPFPMTHIDRQLWERLQNLSDDDIRTHLDKLLINGPKSLIKARDEIVKHFKDLIKDKGEAAVLVP